MFCTKCGKESVEGGTFCGGCGLNVEPVKANDTYVVAKWKKMKTLPRVLVGCGGCILLIIIFNIFMGLIGGLIGFVGELISHF